MRDLSVLKGLGYLISMLSVILLGIVALEAAGKSQALLACLLLGMVSSVIGMLLRWRSHRLEQHEKDRIDTMPPRAVRTPLSQTHRRAIRDSTTA